jgi:hypothetical protein
MADSKVDPDLGRPEMKWSFFVMSPVPAATNSVISVTLYGGVRELTAWSGFWIAEDEK